MLAIGRKHILEMRCRVQPGGAPPQREGTLSIGAVVRAPVRRQRARAAWPSLLLALLWVVPWAMPAHAQAWSQGAAPAVAAVTAPLALGELPTVLVEGHYDNHVGSSDAASEGVVNADRLTDLPLLRPGEVLETVPGMVVTQHSGDGKANQYWLRGYNLDHGTDFATFVDGLPVNMPTNAHGQGYSDLNFLIPELVQTMDYRKGPYYADEGDFSAAGAAYIHYRNSLDQGLASVTLGSFNYARTLVADSFRLGADAKAHAGGPTLLVALEAVGADGPWVVPEGLAKSNALLRLSDGSARTGWSLDTVLYDAHWNSTDQVPLSLIDSGALNRFGALDPSDGGNTQRYALSGEWHTRNSAGYTRLSAYVEHYQLQLWSDFTFYELRGAAGDQFEQYEDRNTLGGQAVRGWNQTLFERDAVTEVGVQFRHDSNHVVLNDTQARVAFQNVSDDAIGESELGLYAQTTVQWTPWLRSQTGVRADAISMDLRSGLIPQNDGSASAGKLSPKLSLIFGPWARTEYFFNAGTGFHSNDARGVIDKVDPTTLGPASAVPALVGATGWELGLRSEAIEGLQTSLAFWTLNSDSELVYNADSDIGSTTPNGASQRTGVEWNNHLRVGDWLLLDGDLAWIHARFATDNDNGQAGDYIPNAVSQVALLGATVHALGPWSAGVMTRYVGPYPLSQDGTLTAPSAVITNFTAQRSVSKDATLKFDILNLFNRAYYDIAYEQDYQVAPTAAAIPNGITVHPGEPRQFRVSLEMHF